MVKKITIGMVFFMLMSANVYSQSIYTLQFGLMQNTTRERFVEVGPVLGSMAEGFSRAEKIPNSVQNEINRQLADYRPLSNGQVFFWEGSLITSIVSASKYIVLLRITEARNSQWEYYAYVNYVTFGH